MPNVCYKMHFLTKFSSLQYDVQKSHLESVLGSDFGAYDVLQMEIQLIQWINLQA